MANEDKKRALDAAIAKLRKILVKEQLCGWVIRQHRWQLRRFRPDL